MLEKNVDPDNRTGFNYIVCIDLIVLVCIVVVAGRPDGLAITVSAVIVAILALLYRGTVAVKSYVAKRARRRTARGGPRSSPPKAAVMPPARARASRSSWLRDGD